MTVKDLLSEVTQAIVALVVLGPSMFILVYQVMHGQPTQIPDVLAGFDGVVVTFYFVRVQARQVANGLAKATGP